MIVKIDLEDGFKYYECDEFSFNRSALSDCSNEALKIPFYVGILFQNKADVGKEISFNTAYVMENGKTVDVIRPFNS